MFVLFTIWYILFRYWCMWDGTEDKDKGKLWKATSCWTQYVKFISFSLIIFTIGMMNISFIHATYTVTPLRTWESCRIPNFKHCITFSSLFFFCVWLCSPCLLVYSLYCVRFSSLFFLYVWLFCTPRPSMSVMLFMLLHNIQQSVLVVVLYVWYFVLLVCKIIPDAA